MDADKLQQLKVLLDEVDEGCRALSDQYLAACYDRASGDLYLAAYYGAVAKAQIDGVRLPDGVDIESSHTYWLRMAKLYRPNRGGTMPRADQRR